MKSLKYLALIMLVMSVSTTADEEGQTASTSEMIEAKLVSLRRGLKITRIEASEIAGYYLVQTSAGGVIYVNEQADHFFAGDLIRIEASGFINATEESRSSDRKKLLDALDESEMLVYAPAPESIKATITVFTDIDCGYCRKLHREVPELNKLGIAVRYLAFPRAGVGSPSYDKIVSAWCADNPNLALTRAKAGEEIEQKTCSNPVAAQYSMGDQFGVNGTPAIIFEDGRLQPGYVPAAQMAQQLGIN